MKKFFTSVVVVITICWAVGLAAFVPTAQAVALSSGDLIKASLPAVYYYGADAKRYVFPDLKTYQTWYSDFSTVKTITDTELAMISIGGNVTYRPGVKMLKINTDPKVYAIDKDGTLRWVKTEAVASCLYGSSWGTMVQDISDAFYSNYTVGAEISDCAQYNKTNIMAASPDINADKGLAGGASGNIIASLAGDNPSGATLPINATGVRVLKFTLSGSGSVTGLTFKTEGVGNAGDIAAAYLYEGNTRLTSGKSFNTTTKEASFVTNVTLAGSKSYALVVDIATGAIASDQHAFKLLAINGEAIGGVMGNTFTIGAQAVSKVVINRGNVPSNPKVGTEGAEIANFKISGGVNDAVINSIILTQVGSINAEDLTNFVLKQAGNTVATAAGITAGDKITLVFSTPFSLLSGANKTFTLYADVMGRPGRTISVYLDEASDLAVIDSLYGFGATVDNTSVPTFTAGSMEITNEGGVVTIAYNGPIAGNVSLGGQDVTLFKFALTAAAPVEIKNTRLVLNAMTGFIKGSAGTDYFTDIKLIDTDTGKVLAGPVSLSAGVPAPVATSATSGVLTLTDDYSVDGTVNMAITADISRLEDVVGVGELVGNGYKVTLGAAGVIFAGGADVKYSDSNDYVIATDIVPNSPIIGNQQDVKASSLSVGVSTFINSNTHVKGATDAASIAYVLTAGNDSDIKLRKFIVDPLADTTVGGAFAANLLVKDIVAQAKLWNITESGWVLLSGPKSVGSTVTPPVVGNEIITFDNLNLNIPAGDSVVLAVSFDPSTAATTYADDLAFTIEAAANVDAYDKDDNAVTALNALNGLPIALANVVNDTAVTPVISTIEAVGTVGIAADTSDTNYKERLVLMNSNGNKALRLKAKAQKEDFKVTDATFTINTTPTNVKTVKVEYPTNAAQTTMETKIGVIVAGQVVLSGMNWYVPADVDSYTVVSVEANTDTNGALTGNNPFSVQLESSDADFVAMATKVLGLSSGTFAADNNLDLTGITDAVGNNLYARKSLLTFSKNTTTDAPKGSSSATPGLAEYLWVDVTPSAGTSPELWSLTVKVTGSDNAAVPTNWACGLTPALYDKANPSVDLVQSVTNMTGCVSVGNTDTSTYRLELQAGLVGPVVISGTKTLKLELNTAGASAVNDDSVQVSVVNLDAAAVGGYMTDGISWNDTANSSAVANNNGFKVEALPINGDSFGF